MFGGDRLRVPSIALLGEELAVDENGGLEHWIEPCMDCERIRECYRIASVAERDTWWGVCVECIATRIEQNARELAKRAIDRTWEMPASVWSECEICQTLEPIDQLELRNGIWLCVAKHEAE